MIATADLQQLCVDRTPASFSGGPPYRVTAVRECGGHCVLVANCIGVVDLDAVGHFVSIDGVHISRYDVLVRAPQHGGVS